jgi:hypothetical protein
MAELPSAKLPTAIAITLRCSIIPILFMPPLTVSNRASTRPRIPQQQVKVVLSILATGEQSFPKRQDDAIGTWVCAEACVGVTREKNGFKMKPEAPA